MSETGALPLSSARPAILSCPQASTATSDACPHEHKQVLLTPAHPCLSRTSAQIQQSAGPASPRLRQGASAGTPAAPAAGMAVSGQAARQARSSHTRCRGPGSPLLPVPALLGSPGVPAGRRVLVGRGVAWLPRQSGTSKHSVHFHCDLPLPEPSPAMCIASSSRQVRASRSTQGYRLAAQGKQPARKCCVRHHGSLAQ